MNPNWKRENMTVLTFVRHQFMTEKSIFFLLTIPLQITLLMNMDRRLETFHFCQEHIFHFFLSNLHYFLIKLNYSVLFYLTDYKICLLICDYNISSLIRNLDGIFVIA